jgi:hypothetical protein
MKYKQHFKTDCTNWEEARVNSDHNLNVLEGIDKEQKAKGEILWRYFRRNVADGYAYYQIIKVTKKTATIKVCRGICLDEWTDNMLGEENTLPLKMIEELMYSRDALETLFGKTYS